MNIPQNMPTNSSILIYQSEDETVWPTQAQLCELFQKSKSTISEHISDVLQEGELVTDAVVRNFQTTANDGKNYNSNPYNLDKLKNNGFRIINLLKECS